MEKVHTDKTQYDFEPLKVGESVEFVVGDGYDLVNISEGAISAINKIEAGKEVKVTKIAPGKFEVWA